MEKYSDKFLVVNEKTLDNKQTDSTYIPCQNGMELYRYSNDQIALYIPHNKTRNRVIPLLKDYVKLHLEGDIESVWLFHESLLPQIATVVHPRRRKRRG